MTVAVAYHCADGVMIAADGMVTAFVGDMPDSHHTGKKVHVLENNVIFANAGDTRFGGRFRLIVETTPMELRQNEHPIQHTYRIRDGVRDDLAGTDVGFPIALEATIAFEHNGPHHSCQFYQ